MAFSKLARGSLEIHRSTFCTFTGVHLRNEKRQSNRNVRPYLGSTRSTRDCLENKKGDNIVRQHPHIQPLVASRPDHLVCPVCSSGELQQHQGVNTPAACGSCGCTLESAILKTLEQIVVLPDALGKHACQCGHPEMRSLPDDVFHCPACSSEVLPILPGVKAEQNTEEIMKARYTR